ncbi:MAG: glycosyltransferase family 4 protein, partial [Spirochaetota bacterium]
MRIGFDPHLDNINAAFSRYFEKSGDVEFEIIRRPRWADSRALLPLKMISFCVRFFLRCIFRYDITHVNSAKVGFVAYCASFFGARYIFTIHGCPHPEFEKDEGAFRALLSRVEIFSMKKVVRRARLVTTISEFSRKELLDRYGINAEVFYNGVDPMTPSGSKEDAKKALGIAGASPVYISVGRLVPYKNPLRVLDIFSCAEKENPSARLIYLGDGILRAPLLARAGSLGIRERLVYMPRVAFEKIPECYAAADYFVSACDTEG